MEQGPSHKAAKRAATGPLFEYRLYFLHSVDRLISHSHEFAEKSDERAIRTAEAWREGRRTELWSGARKVKSWDPGG